MADEKPIKVFYSDWTGRFFASQHYREEVKVSDDGENITTTYVITGKKYDVTQDIAEAIVTNDIEFVPAEEWRSS